MALHKKSGRYHLQVGVLNEKKAQIQANLNLGPSEKSGTIVYFFGEEVDVAAALLCAVEELFWLLRTCFL